MWFCSARQGGFRDIDIYTARRVAGVWSDWASAGELLDTYDRLKQIGITPYWRIHHGVTLSMYYRDPDGNRMEFQVDCCANADEAHAYMQSEAFAANPLGVEIDADALLAQYRNGASEHSLLAMPVGSPAQIPPEHGLV